MIEKRIDNALAHSANGGPAFNTAHLRYSSEPIMMILMESRAETAQIKNELS